MATDQTPRAGGTGRLADFLNLSLIGKGSYGRVYRGTRKSDGVEYVDPLRGRRVAGS